MGLGFSEPDFRLSWVIESTVLTPRSERRKVLILRNRIDNKIVKSERVYKPDSVFAAKSHRSLEAAMPSLDAEAIIPLGRRSLDGSMQPTRGFGENAAKRSHA